jgi:predicted 3-demethylubiquinone-9 3-methyltransferase (glyoxalase superfamily)
MTTSQKIATYLWFDDSAEQAVELYTSIFPGSRVTRVARWGKGAPRPERSIMVIEFELAGRAYIALDGGPHFKFTPAISLFVSCRDQEEVDALWSRFLESGGKAGQCGWLEDRFGLSWQIVPAALVELLSDPDPVKAGRVGQALMHMTKIDVAALQRAAAA